MSDEAFIGWLGGEPVAAVRPWVLISNQYPAVIGSSSRRGGPENPHLVSGSAGGPTAPGGVHHDTRHPFYRLVDLLRPDHSDLWAFLLFAALIGGLSLATPIAVQQLVNSIAFGGLIQPVVFLALVLLAVLAFSGVLSAVQAYVAELIQRRVFVRVVLDVAERLPRVKIKAFDQSHGPELVNRVFDIVTVQKVGSMLLLEGTAVMLQTIVGLTVLSFYHPLMLGFSGLLIAGIIAVVVIMGRGAVGTAIAESKTKYAVVHWLEELARHSTSFRSEAERRYARRRMNVLASGYVGARKRHYRIVFRQFGAALTLQVIASSALLALGGMLVVQGQLTLGQLVASELIITTIVAAVAKFGKQLESFYDLLAAIDKLSHLVDLPLERHSGSDLPRHSGPAEIHLADVDFAYETGARSKRGPAVIQDFGLRIAAGEKLALRGAMGTGKSTLLDLLVGLREPTSGSISIDDLDYRDLRLEEVREAAVLIREPEIFSGTLLENVQMGRRQYRHADILAALEAVGLVEEIRMLPDGLESRLETDGSPLSQVQVVRLMLARAILGSPRLLMLDRALEHLDDEARQRIGDILFAASAPWTLVLVTEREDLLARCTRELTLGTPEIWRPDEEGGENP